MAGMARLGRELAGGSRYLIQHLARPEAVPRFVEVTSEVRSSRDQSARNAEEPRSE